MRGPCLRLQASSSLPAARECQGGGTVVQQLPNPAPGWPPGMLFNRKSEVLALLELNLAVFNMQAAAGYQDWLSSKAPSLPQLHPGQPACSAAGFPRNPAGHECWTGQRPHWPLHQTPGQPARLRDSVIKTSGVHMHDSFPALPGHLISLITPDYT